MKVTYETICNAVKGNTNAMEEILEAYQPYIRTLATFKPSEIAGVKAPRLDQDAAQILREKLMEEIPKWKEICK